MADSTQLEPNLAEVLKQAEGNLHEIARLQAGDGASQQIAVSMRMATQNAVQYLQSVLVLSSAATAQALQVSLSAQQPRQAELANITLSLAQNVVQQSID